MTATNSCNLAVDFIVVTYTPAPSVFAGNDVAICGTNPSFTLNGLVTGAGGGVWTTSGTGTFAPSTTNLNAVYTATPADIAGGSVVLTLTSTCNGSCNPVSDSLTLTYTLGVTVDAGIDQLVCSTAGFTNLQGSVTNGSTTGIWTTLGTGTFAPDSLVLGADSILVPEIQQRVQ